MKGEEEMAGEEQMQKSKACSSLAPNSSFYFDLASLLIERMTLTFEKSGKILLAAVQDTPVNFDLEASISKFQVLTREASEKARELVKGTKDENCPVTVVFPEAFLSCYPRGYDFGAKIGSRTPEGRSWFSRYHSSSVPVSDLLSPSMTSILKAASSNKVTLVVGVIERCDGPITGLDPKEYGSSDKGGDGTLYCTSLTIDETGKLLSSHRKLMPTGTERLVWGQGDGAGVRVVQTASGKVGSVICWENYMPLHRAAVYSQGVEVYTAPTADCRDTWTSSMRHIASEGRCFVVSCCQFNKVEDYPEDYPPHKDLSKETIITRGGSVIVSPMGEIITGPLFDSKGILTALVDRSDLTDARMDFDVMGSYARNDVFSLKFDSRSKGAVDVLEDSS